MSATLISCGSKTPDATRSLSGLNELKGKVSSLDQSCQVDSDCQIVTDDFACNKSYVAISKAADSEYQKLKQKAEALNKNVGCTMEYSERYNPNNYLVFCSATNFCSLEFQEPPQP